VVRYHYKKIIINVQKNDKKMDEKVEKNGEVTR